VARDDGMTPGQRFRAWVLGQRIEGHRVFARDAMRLCVEGASSKGEVNFYDMGDGSEIAEMRIFRATDGEQVFFLHFMMEDEARARELFHEMRDALLELAERRTMRSRAATVERRWATTVEVRPRMRFSSAPWVC